MGPGSGEVNLLKLDDVDEDSAKVDGKFLKYESSTGKFVGADASGSGSGDIAGISTTGTSVFNQINASGITTVAQLSGYSHLIARMDQLQQSQLQLLLKQPHIDTMELEVLMDMF